MYFYWIYANEFGYEIYANVYNQLSSLIIRNYCTGAYLIYRAAKTFANTIILYKIH